MKTRSILLVSRPKGIPRPEDFELKTVDLPPLSEGDVLVANDVLSMDAGVRGFLDDKPGYLKPVGLGEAVYGMSIGRVIESRNPACPEGTVIRAMATWSEHSILNAGALGLDVVRPHPGLKLQTYMGALGPVGMTAWIGLNEIGKIKAGETVLISAAAGATGGLACQISKLRGCRVIGLAGSAEKRRSLESLGVDAAIDYRTAPDVAASIAAACPEGIDVFFDNVGGETLETVLPLMKERGRVVACGMMSGYNDVDQPYGVKTLWQIVLKRLTMRGFLTFDHTDRIGEAAAELEAWALAGKLRLEEHVYEGIASTPRAFIDLMTGKTIGKTLVQVSAAG